VENVVNLARIKGFADIFLDKLESRIIAEMVKIMAAAGKQVVDDHYAPPLAEKGIAEMRAQETGAAGYEGAL
jgi:hypothetical protein